MNIHCVNADCPEQDVPKDVPEHYQADFMAGDLEIVCGKCGEPIPPGTAS